MPLPATGFLHRLVQAIPRMFATVRRFFGAGRENVVEALVTHFPEHVRTPETADQLVSRADEQLDKRSGVMKLPLDRPIPVSWHDPNDMLPKRYRYVVRAYIQCGDPPEEIYRMAVIDTDERPTRGELDALIEAEMVGLFDTLKYLPLKADCHPETSGLEGLVSAEERP